MMQIIYDQILIRVDNVYDVETESGMALINEAYFIDKERDRYERKIRYGIIESVPLEYSEKKHMPIDPGYPNPRLYTSHDDIQEKVNVGYEWGNAQYSPAAKEGLDYKTIRDYGLLMDLRVGDKVYFHPSVTEADNSQEEGIYRAQVHEIVSTVRDGVVIAQGEHLLVQPHTDEELVVVDMVLTMESQDKLLEGTVVYGGQAVGPGDVICFEEDSNWEFVIEGIRYFAMIEENVFLKLKKHG
jgi:hypothetical protein